MSDRDDDRLFAERAFAQLESIEPSAELMRRVAEIPVRAPRSSAVRWPFESWWAPLLAGAFVALLGVSTGWSESVGASEDLVAETSVTLASVAEGDGDWGELTAIAWGEDAAFVDSLEGP